MNSRKQPPPRQAVLVVVHTDGYLEAFADKSVDVRFARMLEFDTPAGEDFAEQCFEMLLPRRYRDLWRRDFLRANGTTDLLRPQAVADALAARDCLATLDPHMPREPKQGAA